MVTKLMVMPPLGLVDMRKSATKPLSNPLLAGAPPLLELLV